MDIFDEKKGITAKRVKGFGPNGLAKLRSKLDGKKVTIEYKTGKVYSGELKVEL